MQILKSDEIEIHLLFKYVARGFFKLGKVRTHVQSEPTGLAADYTLTQNSENGRSTKVNYGGCEPYHKTVR